MLRIKSILSFLLVAFLLSSCTPEKRLYTGGYYWPHSRSTRVSESHEQRITKPISFSSCALQFASIPVQKDSLTEIQGKPGRSPGNGPGPVSFRQSLRKLFITDPPQPIGVKTPGVGDGKADHDSKMAVAFLVSCVYISVIGIILAMVFARRSLNENRPGPDFDPIAWRRAKTVWNIGIGFFVATGIAILAYYYYTNGLI